MYCWYRPGQLKTRLQFEVSLNKHPLDAEDHFSLGSTFFLLVGILSSCEVQGICELKTYIFSWFISGAIFALWNMRKGMPSEHFLVSMSTIRIVWISG